MVGRKGTAALAVSLVLGAASGIAAGGCGEDRGSVDVEGGTTGGTVGTTGAETTGTAPTETTGTTGTTTTE